MLLLLDGNAVDGNVIGPADAAVEAGAARAAQVVRHTDGGVPIGTEGCTCHPTRKITHTERQPTTREGGTCRHAILSRPCRASSLSDMHGARRNRVRMRVLPACVPPLAATSDGRSMSPASRTAAPRRAKKRPLSARWECCCAAAAARADHHRPSPGLTLAAQPPRRTHGPATTGVRPRRPARSDRYWSSIRRRPREYQGRMHVTLPRRRSLAVRNASSRAGADGARVRRGRRGRWRQTIATAAAG